MTQTIIYMTDPGCAPCKKYLPLVKQCAEPLGIEVDEVQLSSERGTALALKYGFQMVPTLIFNDGGGDAEFHSGPRSRGQVKNLLGDLV